MSTPIYTTEEDRQSMQFGIRTKLAHRDAEIAELVAALERMRVAGGSQEFHIAWELAKDVLDKVRKP